MTCVVAVKDERGVVIGADTRFTTGSRPMTVDRPKIFSCGDALIGTAGGMVYINALVFNLGDVDQPEGMSDEEYICSHLSSAIVECLKRNGHAEATQDADDCLSLLIAFKGRIFRGNTMGLLYETTATYHATGSGGDFALGSLFATADSTDAHVRARQALEAAATFDTFTGAPFHFMRSDIPGLSDGKD